MSDAHDPLPHLTAGLRALLRRQAMLDRLERERRDIGAVDAAPGLGRWREENLATLDYLERAIAGVAAVRAGDAVMQVLIAAGRVQGLGSQTCEQELLEELDVVRRLLRAALPALARGAGVELAAYGADHYGHTAAAHRRARPRRPAGAGLAGGGAGRGAGQGRHTPQEPHPLPKPCHWPKMPVVTISADVCVDHGGLRPQEQEPPRRPQAPPAQASAQLRPSE